MAQTKPTSIFHQVQQLIADQLNSDEMLSAANVTFVAENSKDIDYEVQNALGKQGIVGLVMTPKADYIGMTAKGEVAYDLRDLTIQIVENVPVNRGLPNSTTALDAAQRAQELLASPNFTAFGVMNPVSIEQGEDSGLIVCQAKFNCNVHAKYINLKTTKVKYTEASGLPEYEELVVGEFSSIPNPTFAEVLTVGNVVTSIAESLFMWNTPNLTSIVLPDSVQSIGELAFNGCKAVVSITMPSRMSSIGQGAFYFCQNLESIIVPEGVSMIESQTFSVCSSLSSISLPSTLSSIGQLAFSGCGSLGSATIPAAVESIGENAFYNCTSLTSLVLEGKTLEQIQAMDNYPWGITDPSIIEAG